MSPYGVPWINITDRNGENIPLPDSLRPPVQPNVLEPAVAYLMQNILSDNNARSQTFGLTSGLTIDGYPGLVGAKTGTSNDNRDLWTMGFTRNAVVGVWMGRDDAKPVAGLQGGRAPAQAFAAFMRYAVKDRPVEEFDTTLELPEWQLEPDEEMLLGEPDDYYFIDEQGNLVEPGRREPGDSPFGTDEERGPNAPPAASDDFLEEATGGAIPREPRRQPPPQQQGLKPPDE